MAANNWPEPILPDTLSHEGEYTNDRRDPGNWTGGKVGVGVLKGTNYGIAAHSFPHLDIRNLTLADVGPIYRAKYWDKVRGDQLPSGVDLVTFDAAVNSGPSRGARWTQAAVGVKQDGAIGRVTLAALASAAPAAVVTKATDYRLAFMQGLAIWKTFGRGWGRRVGAVRAKGLKLAGMDAPAIARDSHGLDKQASNDNRGAAATGTGAGGSGVAGVDQAASLDWMALVSLGFLGGLLAAACIFLVLRARAKHQAADAMRAVVADMEI